MDWHTAYLTQARADFEVLRLLVANPNLPDCHRLHYLQMVTEKLAKGYLTPVGGGRYANTHDAFVHFLQAANSNPELRGRLGISRRHSYAAYLRNLLPLAYTVEGLSPEGIDHPNPEYPWKVNGLIYVPATYRFTDLNFRRPEMVQLLRFIELALAED